MSKSIYVGNLPWAATEEQVQDLFAEYGKVLSVKLVSDRETGRARGFGFVEMEDGEAQAARTAASGKPCDSAEHARCGYGKGTGGTAGYRGVVHRIPGELAARGAGGV